MKFGNVCRFLASALMSAVLFVGSVSIPVSATELSSSDSGNRNDAVDGCVNEYADPVSETVFNQFLDTEKVYEGDGYSITFSLVAAWEGGYNLAVAITNTGDSPIENWFLSFDYAADITNIWNAEVFSRTENDYVVKNAIWNSDILPGEAAFFGFAEAGSFPGFPENVSILMPGNIQTSDDHSVTFSYDGEWGEGFVANITISNDSTENIEDWILEFDFDREITSVWNANLESHEGCHYVIKRAQETFCIAPGQAVTFGFIGEGGEAGSMPENYILSGSELYSTDHSDPNHDVDDPVTYDEEDNDGDGLSNGFEAMIGTDPDLEDTDGDLLSDYQEVYLTWTDPTLYDSDGNGVSDADADLDGDGLGNLEEFMLGTDTGHPDSDRDDLTDYDEVYVYYTDPLNPDTDGDTLCDGDDVILGFSPLIPDTDLNGIGDADEKVFQTTSNDFPLGDGRGIVSVSVSMSISGNIDKEVEILNVYDFDAQSREVVGLIGVPMEIRSDVEFDSAIITFTYDETMLGDTLEEDLALMWYDEENDWYQILDRESVVDTVNNTVSYTTTHFSRYHLEDVEQWHHAWSTVLDYPSLLPSPLEDLCRPTDYFLFKNVSSYTLSVSDSTPSRIVGALNDYVASNEDTIECDIQYKNGNGGFFSGSYEYMNSSREYFSSHGYTFEPGEGIDHMLHPYMTPSTDEIIESIVCTVNNYSDSYEDKNKAIIWIVDDYVNISETTMQKCRDAGIRIYIIDISNHLLYESMVNYQNMPDVKYYNGVILNDSTTLIKLINQDINTITDATDNDMDGLPDIYETIGMQCSNGRLLYSDPNKKDTDGDTLVDGVEIGAVFKENLYIGNNTYRTIYLFTEHSDPSKEDTDGDGLNDAVDNHPLTNIVSKISLQNIYDGVNYLNVDVLTGGNQHWWGARHDFPWTDEPVYEYYKQSDDYRIERKGCGLIALTDIELYFLSQNKSLNSSLHTINIDYDNNGHIEREDYMDYVEYNYENIYDLNGDYIGFVNGIWYGMDSGLDYVLRNCGYQFYYSKWAPYCLSFNQSEDVLNAIKKMLSNNIPVVFAFDNTFDKNTRLRLYADLDRLFTGEFDIYNYGDDEVGSHYMTIIGYMNCCPDGKNYKNILEVVSWGRVYYIDYNEFSRSLNQFSNILEIYS